MRIACIIPTYNGRDELARLLQSLDEQILDHDLIIVDSSSTDGSAELAQQAANTFITIPSSQFNHGGTRQMVVDRFPDYEILVFLTQDAILASPESLAKLVSNFNDSDVGAVCARQLPHHDASPFAEHARLFNYPPTDRIADKAAIGELGLKSAFLSNSCAAYRRSALLAAGGFPTNVILAEDMYVAARMILLGWKMAYDSQATCYHSHNYTVAQEFKRYFDLGVFHAREAWIRSSLGGAGGEGRKYVLSELRFLKASHKVLWPESLCRSAVKLLGYKLGQAEANIPVAWKRKLSMHRGFWK